MQNGTMKGMLDCAIIVHKSEHDETYVNILKMRIEADVDFRIDFAFMHEYFITDSL